MQKITPFLWFDNQAEEAMNFYTGIFADSKILEITRYGEAGPGPSGSVAVVRFQLEGQEFTALNGGPVFKFNPAISLVVNCRDQAEVDRFWEQLSAGGEAGQCGWLKDRFGVSWQIVPNILAELLRDTDQSKTNRVTETLLKMTRIDIAALRAAYEGRTTD